MSWSLSTLKHLRKKRNLKSFKASINCFSKQTIKALKTCRRKFNHYKKFVKDKRSSCKTKKMRILVLFWSYKMRSIWQKICKVNVIFWRKKINKYNKKDKTYKLPSSNQAKMTIMILLFFSAQVKNQLKTLVKMIIILNNSSI